MFFDKLKPGYSSEVIRKALYVVFFELPLEYRILSYMTTNVKGHDHSVTFAFFVVRTS
jgi:hypothetical protein